MTNHSKNENSGAGRRGGWAGAPAALKLAQEWRCPLIECSAKKKENISKVFYTIMEEILTRPGALPCDVSAPPPVIISRLARVIASRRFPPVARSRPADPYLLMYHVAHLP